LNGCALAVADLCAEDQVSALPKATQPVPAAHGVPALRTPDLQIKRQTTQILTTRYPRGSPLSVRCQERVAILTSHVPDKLTQPLLDSSFQYVQRKRAFETAIAGAGRKGWSGEEIARVTLTVGMIEVVAGC
jgi:hypothetical protein